MGLTRRERTIKVKTTKPIRILLADDHAVLRQGLKQILADEFSPAEFGEAANTQECIDLLKRAKWDVLVLDVNMPGRSGLEALRFTQQNYPQLPVLVLSMFPEDQLAVRVLKAGAAGYLNKQTAPEELVVAIRKVLGGGKYVSTSLAEKLALDLHRPTDRPPHELLSNREFQVMQMLVEGKPLKDIAVELGLSVKTVSTFRSRLLTKLDLETNVDLVHYTLEHGISSKKVIKDKEA
jgi:DNA-binding NarL/FixJ family response regulator